MTTTPLSPIDLFAAALHIHPDGDVRAAERRMTNSDSGAWQLATFHVETDVDVHADRWEMHPQAEEAVCCLTGGVRLYFRPARPDDTEDMVQLQPGTAVIVPVVAGTAWSWTPQRPDVDRPSPRHPPRKTCQHSLTAGWPG